MNDRPDSDSPLDRRLGRHLRSTADHVEMRPGSETTVRRTAQRRSARRRQLTAAASVVVVGGVTVAGVTYLSAPEPDTLQPGDEPIVPPATQTDEVATPPAASVEPQLVWNAVRPNSAEAVASTSFGFGTSNDFPGISVSTAPGKSNDYVVQLWRSEDGVTFTQGPDLPADFPFTSLRAANGASYLFGTAPGIAATDPNPLTGATSSDLGETWTQFTLPIDTNVGRTVAGIAGGGTSVRQVTRTDAGTMVVVDQNWWPDIDDGRFVFQTWDRNGAWGWYNDDCRSDMVTPTTAPTHSVPPDDELTTDESSADASDETSTTTSIVPTSTTPVMPTTTVATGIGVPPAATEGSVTDSTVPVPVTVPPTADGSDATTTTVAMNPYPCELEFFTWDQLDIAPETAALLTAPISRYYWSTDGVTFAEIAPPPGTDSVSWGNNQIGDQHVVVAMDRFAVDLASLDPLAIETGNWPQPQVHIYRTSDGVTWEDLGETPPVVESIGEVNGQIVVAHYPDPSNGQMAVATRGPSGWEQHAIGPAGIVHNYQQALISPSGVTVIGVEPAVDDTVRWTVSHSADGRSFSTESIAELAGVADADIANVARLSESGNQVVIAVTLVGNDTEVPEQIVLVGTPK